MTSILIPYVVDDDATMCEQICKLFLNNEIGNFAVFNDLDLFLNDKNDKGICLFDYRFPGSGMTGIDAADKIKERFPLVNIIIMTGYLRESQLIELLNLKAFKYIDKNEHNFNVKLLSYIKQAIERVKEDLLLESLRPSKRKNGDTKGS